MNQNLSPSRGIFFVIIALLLVACISLLYLLIDRSISFSYLDASYQTTQQSYSRVIGLLENEWRGMPEKEVLARLQAASDKQPEKILIKKEGSTIWFDSMRFEFESGRLVKIL
jgi:Immunity protein 58